MAAVPLPVLTVAGGMVHIHTYLRVMLDDEEQVMLRYVITAPVWLAALPCRVGARDQRVLQKSDTNWVPNRVRSTGAMERWGLCLLTTGVAKQVGGW